MHALGPPPTTRLPLSPGNSNLLTPLDYVAIKNQVQKSQNCFKQLGELLLKKFNYTEIDTLFESMKHELDVVRHSETDQFDLVKESFDHINPPIRADNLKQLRDTCRELVANTRYTQLEKCRELWSLCREASQNKDLKQLRLEMIKLLKIIYPDLFKEHQEPDGILNDCTSRPKYSGSEGSTRYAAHHGIDTTIIPFNSLRKTRPDDRVTSSMTSLQCLDLLERLLARIIESDAESGTTIIPCALKTGGSGQFSNLTR